MSNKPKYIVVENSGMVGEQDVASFSTHSAARGWIERTYSAKERDRESPYCLYPDVCLEEDGMRRYDI